MDSEPPSLPLERSVSQHSATSMRSARSSTVRAKRSKLNSQPSSSASSIAASEDKSLTSFPSIPPDSPRADHAFPLDEEAPEPEPPATVRKISDTRPGPISLMGGLTGASSAEQAARDALFEDSPISTHKIPGALHHADDEHIGRLIARHGAVALVRQVATDLAQRDAQIAQLRRKADERERALRKIILECGLSNLDLETRLRAVESEVKTSRPGNRRNESGLSDLMSDAMQDTVIYNVFGQTDITDGTIRASNLATPSNSDGKGTARGWKDYLWGGTSRKSSVPSSVNGDDSRPATVVRAQSSADRRPGLQDDLFSPPSEGVPPESVPPRTPSRASSIQSGPPGSRKVSTSVAASLMRLVAGGAINTREGGPNRGRSNSATQPQSTPRASSTSSAKTSQSSRAVSTQGGPKALMAMRRTGTTTNATPAPATPRTQPQERWDTMVNSPTNAASNRQESYGPVEMDAILPPETQPPTLTHIYNNYVGTEYLTDRFGFIYDQRRKKRQREAAQMARRFKQGSRTEMLSNGRSELASPMIEEEEEVPSPMSGEERPDSPSSTEERAGEGRPKKWQDYLKLATFPTELLSHTPALSAPSLEVLEGGDLGMKSPGLIAADERGFVPIASTTTSVIDSEATPPVDKDAAAGMVVRDDTEPVKLLLQHMGELHDSLQREKAARWNEFLRKVRAERKRDGEAAAAAAAALAEARYERPAMNLPEAALADGELIGITALGIKGKVGRAKRTELRNLVLGGIPVNLRAKVWSECSGATALRIPGYYQDIIARSDKDDDPLAVTQIEMDINRTLTDNIFFRKGPGVAKLKEVLKAYARRNPEVGYCQGMNLIVANLLLIMPSAEDAFWILTSIIENILPSGYYDHFLLASRADQQVLRQYVAEVLPKLSQHLDDLGIELEALTFQWFLSVFTDCLCAEALFRVWDVVLCMNDGSTFLFQVALALLKLNEPQLLQCDTPASVYTYINRQMTNHAISIDNMIKASDGLRKEVKREDVEARRDKAIQAEKDAARQRDEMNTAKKSSKANGNGNGHHGGGHAESEAAVPESGSDVGAPMPVEQEEQT
ncbi:TBC domain-containing protein [Colletotrichum tabaci]|uniref:TBC domain-containing protein n=1 Tax=Colletotrichum tabaci TaxID=1209068 RepID=A0AAV9TQT5_9PEZI